MLNEKLKQILKIALPVIFIAYFCSITFFSHSHVVNGVTIVHSHPYKTDANGNPTHEHSGNELQLIAVFSTFFVAGAIIFTILLNLFSKRTEKILTEYVSPIHARRVEPHHRLRPPPAL